MAAESYSKWVSPDGRVFTVADGHLAAFAVREGLIDQAKRCSANVRPLLDPTKDRKSVKQWKPLFRLRFLRLLDANLVPVAGRCLEPVLGDPLFFTDSVAPMHPDMGSSWDGLTFGKYLKGTYYPNGKDKPPASHYKRWQLVEGLSDQEKEKLLLDRQACACVTRALCHVWSGFQAALRRDRGVLWAGFRGVFGAYLGRA